MEPLTPEDMKMERYSITVWHGESKSLWFVGDTYTEDMVDSFPDRESAERYIEELLKNEPEEQK